MARPREFDSDRVLSDAMQLFWTRGYAATAMSDVVERTGLNRASLYNAFGGKRELFLAALDRYHRDVNLELVKMLGGPGRARHVIGRAMRRVAAGCLGGAGERGCLLANTVVELAQHDPYVRSRVARHLAQLERAFEDAVIRGQAAGELSRTLSPRQIARFLFSTVEGLMVMGKTGTNRRAVTDVVRVALSVLAEP